MKQVNLLRACTGMLFLLFLANSSLKAQNTFDLNLAHNWNFLDRDIELSGERFWKKAGVKMGLNYFQHTVIDAAYAEQAYAANFGQHIGFHAAFLYRVSLRQSHVELSPFAKITAFHIGTRLQTDYDKSTQFPAYFRSNVSLGIQAKTQLSGRLMLFAVAEAGMGLAEGAYVNSRQQTFVFDGINTSGGVGLSWRLKK